MSTQPQDAASSQHAQVPWWSQLCHRLWPILCYVWGTLLAGILVGTLSNITTTANTQISDLFISHLVLTFPIPICSGLGLLILLTLVSWMGGHSPHDVTIQRTISEQDRTHLLRRLHLRYEQIYQQSLQGAVRLELELAERPAAVQNAVSLALRLPDQPEHLLPPHTSILEVYEQAQQELLILGRPGAGKSTLLLELATQLVYQAEQDTTRPLPILLPLSSWATKRLPLQAWLIEQFALLYDVPRTLSQHWVQTEELLPLLDGLDEMEESARAACIVAINTYHHEHLRPLVIGSRSNEYTAASQQEQLTLHGAVVVQPLSHAQVDAHLASLGKPLKALRAALRKNTTLQKLATTPLLLQVLMLTYRDVPIRELSHKTAQLQTQIWTDYVEHMISRKGNKQRYPLDATYKWLGWLAQHMQKENQTIFFLEQIQPNWLPKEQKTLYKWSISLLVVLGIGLFVGLLVGQLFGLLAGLFFGLLLGLSFGLRVAMITKIVPAEALSWSWKKASRKLPHELRWGLLVGLVVGLVQEPFIGLAFGSVDAMLFWLLLFGLFGALLGTLFYGLLGALLAGFSGEQLTNRLMLAPNEGIRRSMKNGLLVGLFGALLGALFGALFHGLIGALLGTLLVGLVFGLPFGLAAMLQHYTLRIFLWHSHVFPFKTIPFLEDATARILLRRVGGGYSFTHRLLLDYFADTYHSPASVSPTLPPLPSKQGPR